MATHEVSSFVFHADVRETVALTVDRPRPDVHNMERVQILASKPEKTEKLYKCWKGGHASKESSREEWRTGVCVEERISEVRCVWRRGGGGWAVGCEKGMQKKGKSGGGVGVCV